MKTAELRKLYLDYFVEQGHLLVPSSSFVPYKDTSVLLTTAGMQQFKPYFMGTGRAPGRQAHQRAEVLPHDPTSTRWG